jgi:hypothetical protein
MLKLNETEKRIFSDFLDQLSDYMSNAGCNDYDLPNSEEGKMLWLENENRVKKDNYEPLLDKIPENQKDFCTFDWILLSTLRKKIGL